MSYNDCPEIRALYGGYNVEEVQPRYSAAKVAAAGQRSSAAGREVWITNY